MKDLVILREYFGDIDEDAFDEGSALIGKGEGDGDAPDASGDDSNGDRAHPEWEPLEIEPEEERTVPPEPEDPEPTRVPRPDREPYVHMGTRQVARSADGLMVLNTIEVPPPFEFSV